MENELTACNIAENTNFYLQTVVIDDKSMSMETIYKCLYSNGWIKYEIFVRSGETIPTIIKNNEL